MALYFVDLGVTGLTDVGYVWKDDDGADIGSRTTTGVSEIESGIYAANITPASGAQGIFWDSAAEDTSAFAFGDVRPTNWEVLGIGADGDVLEVNTLTGHTPQTQDHTSALTTIDTVVDGIQADLDNGTDGLGAIKTAVDANGTAIATLNDPTAAAIADAVWDELTSGHATVGSFAERLANIITDTDTTIPGLITALNNISAAEVNAEVDQALLDYDGPTKAELDAGFAALNDPTAVAIAAQVWDELRAAHVTAGSFGEGVLLADGAITAAKIASAAITSAKFGSGAITSSVLAANAIGASQIASNAITAAKIATDAITAAKIAADAIGASELATDAVNEITAAVWAAAARTLTANTNLNDPTAAAIADAVWDELTSGHATPGSFAERLSDILTDTGTTIPGLIAALNDISAAEVNAEVDQALLDYDGPTHTELVAEIDSVQADIAALDTPSAAEIADAVWDEPQAGHNNQGTFGRALKKIYEGLVSGEGAVSDLAATTTSFVTDLTEVTDDHYRDLVISFVSGALTGQAAVIAAYDGTTKTITVDEALTEAPADSDEFVILAAHVHTVSSIADKVWDEVTAEHLVAGSMGAALNEARDNINTVDGKVDSISTDTNVTIPALIAALENLSAAEVNAEVDQALLDYDGPTNAELNAAVSALASQASVDAINTIVAAVLVDTDVTIPALIAALNNLSAAEVNAEVDTAIADAGLATQASVDALPDANAIADQVWDEQIGGHLAAGSTGSALNTGGGGSGGGGGGGSGAGSDVDESDTTTFKVIRRSSPEILALPSAPTTPKADARITAYPDGSFRTLLWSQSADAPEPTIELAVSQAGSRLVVIDRVQEHVFKVLGPNNTSEYHFVVDGDTTPLAVGTYEIVAAINNQQVVRKFVTISDTPFASGANSDYLVSVGDDSSTSLVRQGTYQLHGGETGVSIQFVYPFLTAPTYISLALYDGSTFVNGYTLDITDKTGERFTVEFTPDIPANTSYRLVWAAWV